MQLQELLRWQWDGYGRYHQSALNLKLHIVVVPLFLLGNVGLLVALFSGAWLWALPCAVVMLLSFALQGLGHAKEVVPSVPFSSPGNALARIFLEQWISFPRFVLSGGWLRALRQTA